MRELSFADRARLRARGVWRVLRNRSSAHRRRIARAALLTLAVLGAGDLLGQAPSDARLSLPLSTLRAEAGPAVDEVEVTVLDRESGEPMTHARHRIDPGATTVEHAVHLAPGQYVVRVALGAATPREGHFSMPADGVVRVQLRPAAADPGAGSPSAADDGW